MSWNTSKTARRDCSAPARRWAANWMAKACQQRASPICCMRSSNAATASASKATTRSRPTSSAMRWPPRSGARQQPAHAAVGAGAAGASGCVRARVAARLDFSFSGPQAARVARLASAGKLNIGAIHTYLELFSRYFIDLPPRVCLIAAEAADRHGNLYTGPNTETRRPSSRPRRSSKASSSSR
jgi:hypothetical protein